jgi:arylsulfatase A-like enzyme
LINWDIQDWTWERWQPIVAKYYGEVSLLDHEIGRLLAELDNLGVSDDTIIVITTDHGDMNASHRMYDKGYSMYDEVYHVPMVVRWPGKTMPGSVCDAFVNHFCDLMPTLLETAGLPVPGDIDGRSLVPVLEGRTPGDWRTEMYAEFHGMQWGLYPQRMIRNRRYKFVFNGQDPNELYDLENDPYEVHNVYLDPAYAAVREQFVEKLYQWNETTNDSWRPEWMTSQL